MSGNENSKYLTTKRDYNETVKAYIERISKNKIINFICWTEIDEKLEYIDTGGSGVITKAKWIEKNITVVLKAVGVCEETNSDNNEFIKEIKAFHNIGLVHSSITIEKNKEKTSLVGYKNVIKFFGVSSDESVLYLILEYADLGNLRYYLSKNTINWEQKVDIARQVTDGLYFLHKNEILHRDLHTKNVVIQKDGDGVRVIITDFGRSKVLPRNSKSNQEIGGCVPFVAPEILNHNAAPDFKSDIYSLGVVMWEITSNGRPPFKKCNINATRVALLQLSLKIIEGTRENPIIGTTISYVKLYTSCWDGNSELRPEIEEVYKSLHQEEIISGEKWKDSSQSCISDTDIGQIKSSEKNLESNRTNDEKIFNKISEMFGRLSTEDLEMIEQFSVDNPGAMLRLVQAAAAHQKKVSSSETNGQ
ncbi:16555_t:CDS:2 [Racocetra persica]|uniref:16555_t:CDS:1 n=1 Tax=Racocetra persica TaxID=160502 RepID=A0ACA9KQM4_9GLOM|nr:16555_t:CDS:2 [Racocetra persica]